MGIAQHPSSQPMIVAHGNMEYVERFTYLGSVISRDEMLKHISTLDWQE